MGTTGLQDYGTTTTTLGRKDIHCPLVLSSLLSRSPVVL